MKILSRLLATFLLFCVVPYSTLVHAQAKTTSSEDMSDRQLERALEHARGNHGGSSKKSSQKDSKKNKMDEKAMSLEEARAFIASLPAAEDAISGSVSREASWQDIYDIYSRQIAYRESAKVLRADLLARQESFAAPRRPLLEQYEESLRKVYAAETAAYKKELQDKGKKKPMKKASDSMDAKSAASGKKMASADTKNKSADMPSGGLTEKDIPSNGADESAEDVKRTVVTSEDAPEFDPSNL